MAINDGSENNSSSFTNEEENLMRKSFGGSERAQGNGFAESVKSNQKFDWISLTPGTSINVGGFGGGLGTLVEQFKKYKNENMTSKYEMYIVPIDKSVSNDLPFSVLVVGFSEKGKNVPMAYYSLLLESTFDAPPSIPHTNQNNQVINIPVFASDAYGTHMSQIIDKEVRAAVPGMADYLTGDAMVIPAETDLNDKDFIDRVLTNAALSARNQLILIDDNAGELNLANDNHNTVLTQLVQFNRNNKLDVVGNPVRSDITLITTAVLKDQKPSNIFSGKSSVVTTASGFMEVLYRETQPIAANGGWGVQAQPNSRKYQANFVLTNISNMKIQTLPGILLAIINASSLAENPNNWVPAFRPYREARGDKLLSDIGYLGYDIPESRAAIKTTADKFSDIELWQLISTYFSEGLVISLDIPDCADTSWEYGAFAQAANGDMHSTEEIISAADILTNGNFSKVYKPSNGKAEVCTTGNNRVFLGYYTDKNGQKRDIRDADFLAACGHFGPKDPDEIRTYSDTYNDIDFDVWTRLDTRSNLINNILGAVKYTGMALRVEFTSDFLVALKTAASMCGYHVAPERSTFDVNAHNRYNANFVNNAVINSGYSGIFHNNTVNQGYNQGNFFMGRYGRF